MKKSILIVSAAFTFSAFFTSCREVNEEKTEVEIRDETDDLDEVGDEIEDAADDVGDAVNEGVDEVKENTGTGGTDDQ